MSRRRRTRGAGDDEGSALVLTLVFVLLVSLFILPVMDYVMSVTRANRVSLDRSARSEAVRAGARVALLNPTQLYAACVKSGRTTAIQLAAPPGLGVSSSCTTTADATQDVPSNLRWALTVVQAGAQALVPPVYASPDSSSPELDGMVGAPWCTSVTANPPVPCGKPYPGNGNADPLAWLNDATAASTGGKVFAPQLPPVSKALGAAAGYMMPPGDGGAQCKVYFPGRYIDDVVITGTTPVYFVSGIYYFEKTVRISGDADVVVGTGATQGCADSDAVAIADAINAPLDAYSNGVGGTWVFGASGRLVVDDATSATGSAGAKLAFNRRLVPVDDPLSVLNDISIMSVNGVLDGTTTGDLDLPTQLHVPASTVLSGTTSTDPYTQKYKASTLVSPPTSTAVPPVGPASCAPPPAAVTAACPIIDIGFTKPSSKATVKIPGYVAVPQGSIVVQTAPGAGTGKSVSFGGGVLAAQMAVSTDTPAFLQLGLLNPVVQKTFKIVTTTTSGAPKVTWVTLVQVNETGGWKINSSYEQIS